MKTPEQGQTHIDKEITQRGRAREDGKEVNKKDKEGFVTSCRRAAVPCGERIVVDATTHTQAGRHRQTDTDRHA